MAQALGPAEVAHGPMFIGLIFNLILYGIMFTQTFMYFTTFKKDKMWMKLYVLFLLFADTVNSIFDVIYLYDSLIIHFAEVEYLSRATWVFGTDPATTGIIASFVQLFFAWRVKVLTGNWWLVSIILLATTCSFLCSIATSIAVGMIPEFVQFQRFEVVVILWLAGAAVGDVIITFALVRHLKQHRTGFAATDDVINRIIRVTVQTGMITAVCAVIDLALFLGNPTGLHLVFNIPLSKLYTNSLMSSLNSRGAWMNSASRGANSTEGATSAQQYMSTPHSIKQMIKRQEGKQVHPEVFVSVEQHEMTDIVEADKMTLGRTPPDEHALSWERGKAESQSSMV